MDNTASWDNPAPWFDSHCHLDFEEFDADRDALWQACRAQGIRHLLLPGVTPGAQWQRAQALAARLPGVYYSIGVHPCWLAPWHDIAVLDAVAPWQQELQQHLREPRCIAIGETGLDKRIATPLTLQQEWFEWHLQLACQHSRPLILHVVHAHSEVIALLKRYRPPLGGVVHAFNGSYEIAREYWQLGFCLGIGGTITYERAHKTRSTVQRMPLASLLLETDAPDMPLQGEQGGRNTPANIPRIAECLAQLRGEPVADIQQQTYRNSRRLFFREPV